MLNKKIISATVASALLAAGSATAIEGPWGKVKFGVGIELSPMNKTSYKGANEVDLNRFKLADTDSELQVEKNEVGGAIFANAVFHDNLGLEVGYSWIADAEAAVQDNKTANVKLKNFHVDMLGFIKVLEQVDFVASLGIGEIKTKAVVTDTQFINQAKIEKSKVSARLGAGLQWNIDDNWAVRGMFRYQRGNSEFMKSLMSISVGGSYSL